VATVGPRAGEITREVEDLERRTVAVLVRGVATDDQESAKPKVPKPHLVLVARRALVGGR
jgi:hypothetical protein